MKGQNMNNGKWYIGTMNDGLFIIDRPPKPAPVDYLTAGDPDLKVIAAMGNDKIRTEAIVAAHNEVVKQLRKPMSFDEMKEWLSKQTQSADIETEADQKTCLRCLRTKAHLRNFGRLCDLKHCPL